MGVNGWPGIFSGEYLGQPGWKDIVVEYLHRTGREGNTALRKIAVFYLQVDQIIAFNLDFRLIFN
jgi:hypothetical protein